MMNQAADFDAVAVFGLLKRMNVSDHVNGAHRSLEMVIICLDLFANTSKLVMNRRLIFDIVAVGWNHHCSENPAYSKIDLHKAEGRKYLFQKRRSKKRFLIYVGIQL